ncbi:thiamine phosphate synthase, partial [Burkholderia cenocepacia]|uniref:thiamine phosphate synthase n=1 Tax=Burkholderia cenocepacia TaxID=95486 RepID=UPI00286F82B9
DLETADLAAIARAGLRLGLSSHGYYEMLRALHERPSYLALGPVYATATKAVAAPPQGLARIARYARFAGARAPLVAPHVSPGVRAFVDWIAERFVQ